MATDGIVADIDNDPEEVDEEVAFVKGLDDATEATRKMMGNVVKYTQNSNPDNLSKTLVYLAAENINLAKWATKAKYFARLAERAYRKERESIKLEHIKSGLAVAKSESLSILKTDDVFEAYNHVQLMADEADSLCYRVDTLLKMSQSRLSLIKKDIS